MAFSEPAPAKVVPTFTLGDRLRKARLHAGYTSQVKFAAALTDAGYACEKSTVGHWEQDVHSRIDLDLLRAWAKVTNVDLQFFLDGIAAALEGNFTNLGLSALLKDTG